MMPSGKNAKTNDNEYCRHNTRNSDEYDDDSDSDATITDDEVDHDVEYRELTAPYSVLPSDEDRETIIDDALDELAIIARENILEFKREDFNTQLRAGCDDQRCALGRTLGALDADSRDGILEAIAAALASVAYPADETAMLTL